MSYLIDGKEYSLDDVAQLTKERDELRAQLEALATDKNAVWVIMLRGTIAIPSCLVEAHDYEQLKAKLEINEKVLKHNQDHFKCFSCGDGNTPLYCLNCAEPESGPERVGKIAELNSKLERAEAANCEMRELLTYLYSLKERFSHETTQNIVHALSTDCGKGWLSPEKAGRLRDALREVIKSINSDVCEGDDIERITRLAQQALAETEPTIKPTPIDSKLIDWREAK